MSDTAPHPLHWWQRTRWHRVPHVRSGDQLSVGEQAADVMRNTMGSWSFVFGALLFLAVWMTGNRHHGFDPYPFILLNLVLSCVAALQGAILLIAAKRSDAISAELAQHDYRTNLESFDVLCELERLSRRIEQLTEEIHTSTVPSATP